MNSADVEKTRDLECKLIDNDFPATRYEDVADSPRKMCRKFLLHLLTLSVFAVVLCSATGVGDTVYQSLRAPKSPTIQDRQRIQDVLNSIVPSAQRGVLYDKNDKYKHGVIQGEKTATAVVHQKVPEAATSLVELAKRQGPNNGTTTVPPATSTTATTTEATSTFTSSVTSSTVITQSSDKSSSSPSSPTSQESTSEVTSGATTLVTSTGGSSSVVVVTSSAPNPTSNSQESSSPPKSSSRTPTTSVTSFNIFTTTLPNGKPTTITQTTVVPAGQADQTPVGASSSKTNPGGSLQTNGGNTMKLSANMLVGMAGVLYFGAL